MKFVKNFSICFAIIIFSGSLHGSAPSLNKDQINQVNLEDPKVIQQQEENVMAFVALVEPWKNASNAYDQKNDTNFAIKCKKCNQGMLSLGEFDGYLLGWITKAIPFGHDEFEKIKTLINEYIKLLSTNASSDELLTFMITTSNDMKAMCCYCHGTTWEKMEKEKQ